MKTGSLFPKELMDEAVDLHDIGVNEYVWRGGPAIEAIDILCANGHIILGGDVYRIDERSGRMSHTGDSWYYDPNPGRKDDSWYYDPDPSHNHVRESCMHAKNYISKYMARNGDGSYYSIVCDDWGVWGFGNDAIHNEMLMVNTRQYQDILDTPCAGKRFVGEIDGRAVADVDDFLSEVWRVFDFPDTGHVDHDAYLDWMRDLGWLDSDEYVFAILNYSAFMRDDAHWRKTIIRDLQEHVMSWWESDVAKCRAGGVAKPFNVYLVDDRVKLP